MNVLSIDWDWFFPDVVEYDWGHREEPLFQSVIWSVRASNRNMFTGEWAVEKIVPDENRLKDFWDLQVGDPWMLVVTESHKDMYRVLKELKRTRVNAIQVFNMDAHHDVFYGRVPLIEKKFLDCGNWVYYSWREKLFKEYSVIYPPWRKERPEVELLPADWIQVGFEPVKQHYDVIFICRSSAWTPSWSDDAWLRFVEYWKRVPWLWESRITCQFVQEARDPNMDRALVLRDEQSKLIAKIMEEKA